MVKKNILSFLNNTLVGSIINRRSGRNKTGAERTAETEPSQQVNRFDFRF